MDAQVRISSLAPALAVLVLALLQPERPAAQDQAPSMVRSGSGFVLARSGLIVTNAHVVAGCTTVTVLRELARAPGTVVAQDREIDLAIVKTSLPLLAALALRGGPPLRLGESVVVFGFPLTGSLSREGNLTTGNVSALAGLRDDPDYVQITAPVQPGNSGGPLLDGDGHVIGVVTSKLDALRTVKRTGDVPQNVNFAINLAALTAFLDARHIAYDTAVSDRSRAVADVAESAKAATVRLQCAAADEPAAPSETVRVSPGGQPGEPSPLPVPPPGAPPPAGAASAAPYPVERQATEPVQLLEVRTPYPSTAPAVRELTVINRSSFSVLQITLGWLEDSAPRCPPSVAAYRGTRQLFVSLKPGETTTTIGEFSPRAKVFCLLSAQFLPFEHKSESVPAAPEAPLPPGRLEVTPIPQQ